MPACKVRKYVQLRPAKSPRAFSLIELLVVIAIIAILSGLSVIAFNNIGRSASGRGAADLAASMALSARVEAMSHGYGSLLVIDNSSDRERKYQRMAVFRFTNAGGPPVLAGRMTPLPRGTFFLPGYSSQDLKTTNLPAPPGNAAKPFLYLKFNGSGHLEDPQTADLVFGPNTMSASGSLENPEAMLNGRQGFKLRRNGRPLFFKTLEDMQAK